MESLDGLENIQVSSITELEITGNIRLSHCAVKSICDYLVSSTATVKIENNAPGCDSQLEVESACDTLSIPEINFNDVLVVSPNPFSTNTTIEYELSESGNIQTTIFNHFGQIVETINQGNIQQGKHQYIWNASDLANGIYFVRVRAGQKIATRKVVKMR